MKKNIVLMYIVISGVLSANVLAAEPLLFSNKAVQLPDLFSLGPVPMAPEGLLSGQVIYCEGDKAVPDRSSEMHGSVNHGNAFPGLARASMNIGNILEIERSL